MLNPRAFLEDTLRCGLSILWATGMPWHLINAAIGPNFDYNVSDEAKAYWVANTNRDWDNTQDSPSTKFIKCPACQTSLDVSWTSCGQDETAKSQSGPGLVGNGYGDGDFKWWCTGCGLNITKKLLSTAKFIKDAQALTVNSVPMPGTIIDPVSGKPKAIFNDIRRPIYPRTFPNRLIKRKLIVQLVDLIKPGSEAPSDMDSIRDLIQRLITDGAAIREIEGYPAVGRGRLTVEARICVRKMMSRYWENFSPFALDLSGAVLRQGIFTAKMVHIDWLHSPACRDTMARLTTKYQRFVSIMVENPGKTCVPTLDVDLAWHTHQLSPSAYYTYTTKRTAKFTDHDDKIDEDKLSTSFEWTMKTYQDKYAEVYSECTCWYCETIRSSNTGTVSRILGVSNQDKAAQSFLSSGRAELCPPDKSAHISAHNAVRQTSATSSIHSRVTGYQQARQQRQLEINYEKACKRAKKKGRTLPPRDEYYNHWGYQYYMYSPFVYPLYFTPGLYYGWDPGFVNTGSGWAACAAGSCGGGVAAGACGGAGGCGAAGVSRVDILLCFEFCTDLRQAGGAACGGGGMGGGMGGGCGGGGGGCGGGGGGGGKPISSFLCVSPPGLFPSSYEKRFANVETSRLRRRWRMLEMLLTKEYPVSHYVCLEYPTSFLQSHSKCSAVGIIEDLRYPNEMKVSF